MRQQGRLRPPHDRLAATAAPSAELSLLLVAVLQAETNLVRDAIMMALFCEIGCDLVIPVLHHVRQHRAMCE